ncbi:aldo/keto reductase [Nonomuraea sp. SBT364]|uniref:aldo/keto reductase n=1 Tax=Nonomuraea sp. SBT364 TaxID=1580530 RepID=UPI00066BB8AC|nr:aldo/keto reductase [Nonomuraea sp. SBT364]
MTTTTRLGARGLGRTGPTVSSPGLGGMALSGAYGPVDDDEGVRVLRAYLDAGGTLLDTGDFYGAGHNELLIRRALEGRDRDEVVLSVKFGAMRGPDGGHSGIDARPAAVRNFLTYSLRRLGVDHVDVYRPARLDPSVPVEDTVGAIAELVEKGYVRHIGLSEVGAETIRRASAVAPICDVQLEYSLFSRGIEDAILPVCRELGIGVTAYGVLARGLIGGSGTLGGMRAMTPRFQGANREHNAALAARLEELAEAKGASVAQLAIAWVAAQGEDIVPVVGSRRLDQVGTLVGSGRVSFDAEELARIEDLVPRGAARGDRYPSRHMADLDSER